MTEVGDRVINNITKQIGIVIKKSSNGMFYLVDYSSEGNIFVRWSYFKNIEVLDEIEAR